jgi:hypothetical protein
MISPVAPPSQVPHHVQSYPGFAAWRSLRLAGDLRIQLFGFIFALGTIHHELQFILEQNSIGPFLEYLDRWRQVRPTIDWPNGIGVSLHLADIVISLAIIALPWRRELLCLLAVTFLLSNLVSPERISSHNSLMAGGLSVLLIFGLAEVVQRTNRRGQANAVGVDWYGWTLTGLVSLCVLTYAFAAFHKLNPVWFSPPDSPVMWIVLPFVTSLGLGRETAVALFGYPLVYAVVATEVMLPFLLMRQRTRLLGCLLGLLFHLPMLGQGVGDFPTVILAFYPLFLSVEQARTLLLRCLKRPSTVRVASTALIGGVGIAAIRQSDQVTWLYSPSHSPEPLVVFLHSGLLYTTFILFIYITWGVVALLLEGTTAWVLARVATTRRQIDEGRHTLESPSG